MGLSSCVAGIQGEGVLVRAGGDLVLLSLMFSSSGPRWGCQCCGDVVLLLFSFSLFSSRFSRYGCPGEEEPVSQYSLLFVLALLVPSVLLLLLSVPVYCD